ncbi:helix-turn-helix domain-containing protein [Paenibacillus sp. GYB004]|uniref:helix-turn-helix domain-containing protein n=1 Tax=Paenibacillus sp. GYB004 TaxID=2994393 RepID=UPI002F966CB4
MKTLDLIELIRTDIKRELREEILAELEPEIKQRLYANIFTFDEAMAYLKVSESTLRRMVRDGEVPFFRQRVNLYFRQIDLDKTIRKKLKRHEFR